MPWMLDANTCGVSVNVHGSGSCAETQHPFLGRALLLLHCQPARQPACSRPQSVSRPGLKDTPDVWPSAGFRPCALLAWLSAHREHCYSYATNTSTKYPRVLQGIALLWCGSCRIWVASDTKSGATTKSAET